MRIGILTGGGDVPGLNPCIKALVYRAVDEGHEVVGFRRGWWGPLNVNPDDPDSHEKCFMPLDKDKIKRAFLFKKVVEDITWQAESPKVSRD